MRSPGFVRILTLAFSGQLIFGLLPGSNAFPAPLPGCVSHVLQKLRMERSGPDSVGYRENGFAVGAEGGHFDRSITLNMGPDEWSGVKRGLITEFRGFQSTVEGLRKKTSRALRPSIFVSGEIPGGVELKGSRYLVHRSGANTRIYRLDLIERVTRSAQGDVEHYISANFTEVDSRGKELRRVIYADSPHVARGKALWFHAHDSETGQVIAEIPAGGFAQSAYPGILTWANRYLKGKP